MMRDYVSNLRFYNCISPQCTTVGAITGTTIDRAGYEVVFFACIVGDHTSGGAWSVDNRWQLKLEHGPFESAAATSVWSEVYPSQMIHSVTGMDGAYSTLNSGIFQSIFSTGQMSTVYWVGYRGNARYVRIVVSQVGAPSICSIAVVAVLGLPMDWPVNTPV